MNNGDRDGYDALVQPCEWLALGGHWSGTEGRRHQHFIAVIPTTRYVDVDEVRRRELRRIAQDRENARQLIAKTLSTDANTIL